MKSLNPLSLSFSPPPLRAPCGYLIWRPFFRVQFFSFWIHFKVVFPHSILSFTFALALLTLSVLGSSVSPLTHKRQPLSVNVDVFTTRHSDILTHTHTRTHSHETNTRIQTETNTHIHAYICKHSHYNSSENQKLFWGYGPIEIFTIFHMFNNTITSDKPFYFGHVHCTLGALTLWPTFPFCAGAGLSVFWLDFSRARQMCTKHKVRYNFSWNYTLKHFLRLCIHL